MRVLTENFFWPWLKEKGQVPKWLKNAQTVSGASVTLSRAYVVPQGYDLILTSCVGRGSGGVGQNTDEIVFLIYDPTVTNPVSFGRKYFTADQASRIQTYCWGSPVHVPENSQLYCFVYFSAGGVTNNMSWEIMGFLIPAVGILTS